MKQMSRVVAIVLVLFFAREVARSQIHFTATMDGAQQVPPVVTPGGATGSFELSDDLTQLRYFISYQGLSTATGVGGHFHFGKAGTDGGIAKDITTPVTASGTFAGVWTSADGTQPLTPAVVESLLTGRIFFNLHTQNNPGGEIRGQVTLATSLHFEVSFSGAQEVPAVVTTAGGTGVFVLDPARTRVDYWVTYRGLSGPLSAGGHVHTGAVGKNGGIVRTLALTGDSASASIKGSWKSSDGTQPLTAALVDSLIAGRTYANFHTSAHPGGEMRGQLVLKGGIGFVASLEPSKENPPNSSTGSATGSFVLNGTRTALTYNVTYINLTGTLTAGGHIHQGNPARNGPVVKSIAVTGDPAANTVSGIWQAADAQPLTAALVESLFTSRTYANFHTAANPGGELRGQLDMTTGLGFTSRLSGLHSVPPVVSDGSGTGSVVLDPDRQSVHYSFTYFGLSGPLSAAGAHFHGGGPTVNGGILKTLAAGASPAALTFFNDWSSADLTQTLTTTNVDSLIAGKMYANFHTTANPGGEIRGQLTFGFDVTTAVQQSNATIPGAYRLEQNYPNPFNPTTQIQFTITEQQAVRVRVFDLLGREVATLVNDVRPAGTYTVRFSSEGLAGGVYFYRLQAGSFAETRKMLLVK